VKILIEKKLYQEGAKIDYDALRRLNHIAKNVRDAKSEVYKLASSMTGFSKEFINIPEKLSEFMAISEESFLDLSDPYFIKYMKKYQPSIELDIDAIEEEMKLKQ